MNLLLSSSLYKSKPYGETGCRYRGKKEGYRAARRPIRDGAS
jgi:hypothetical protein